MPEYKNQLQITGTIREYETALKSKAYILASRIYTANPTLRDDFDAVDFRLFKQGGG